MELCDARRNFDFVIDQHLCFLGARRNFVVVRPRLWHVPVEAPQGLLVQAADHVLLVILCGFRGEASIGGLCRRVLGGHQLIVRAVTIRVLSVRAILPGLSLWSVGVMRLSRILRRGIFFSAVVLPALLPTV